ncbi:diguanylate cyclase [Thiohalophilus sp.]|uniref:sensor domain-containing diguanylate cyclase n=1 Tax=Thiohalophilus sp. TaxID=3028392 RepID=UPI002ACE44BA|nr:diguanylate cyclase [Thiohalophilus sp.]MDZ7661819.1 diguanylate cyclase [Thiohalophilus sp.]
MHPDEAAFRSLVEQSGDTVLLLDPAGTVAYANPAAEQLFGRPLANLIGEDFGGISTAEEQSDIYIPHPKRGNVATNARSTTIRLDGIPYTAVYLRDISERAQAEERLRQSSVALDAIDQGLMITRPDTTIVAVNPAFTTITGYTEQEVLGGTPDLLLTGEQEDEESYTEMRRTLEREGHWTGVLRQRRKNGEIYHEWLNVSPVRRDNGDLMYYVAIFSDMTDINKLRQLAHHDYLTGLFNRAALQQHLDEEMRRIARYGGVFSLIMFDLDHFKAVNDNYGHDTGDRVLQQVAELTLNEVRDTDVMARWGGEEFMILLPATDGDRAWILAERIRKRTARTSFLESGYITISLGVAEMHAGEPQQDSLIRVDQALYRAKETRNRSEMARKPGPREASR